MIRSTNSIYINSIEPSAFDYIELLKIKVMRLAIFTAGVAMIIAPIPLNPFIALGSIVCIALGAGASGALNMWWDSDIDSVMKRTLTRPIPSGKITSDQALSFGIFLSVFSVIFLALFANFLSALLLAITISFYIFIYTMFLKRTTPYNIVIGGAAGAFPPMIGWAVSTNTIGIESILLFLLIFLWTPPHFWSLCLITKNDYSVTKVPMLTETHGVKATKLQIFIYSIILSIPSILISFSSIGGLIYLISSIFLNVIFIFNAYVLMINSKNLKKYLFVMEKRLFLYSIFYLFVTFLLLLVEHFSKFFLPSYLVMIEDLLWI